MTSGSASFSCGDQNQYCLGCSDGSEGLQGAAVNCLQCKVNDTIIAGVILISHMCFHAARLQYQVKIQLQNKKFILILLLLFDRQNREVGNENDNGHKWTLQGDAGESGADFSPRLRCRICW